MFLADGNIPITYHLPSAGWDARTCFQRHWLAQAWTVDVVQASAMPPSPV